MRRRWRRRRLRGRDSRRHRKALKVARVPRGARPRPGRVRLMMEDVPGLLDAMTPKQREAFEAAQAAERGRGRGGRGDRPRRAARPHRRKSLPQVSDENGDGAAEEYGPRRTRPPRRCAGATTSTRASSPPRTSFTTMNPKAGPHARRPPLHGRKTAAGPRCKAAASVLVEDGGSYCAQHDPGEDAGEGGRGQAGRVVEGSASAPGRTRTTTRWKTNYSRSPRAR